MSCRFDRQARRGFTLTEIAIVMGVVGLILGAIWVAASQVRNAKKTQLAVQETFQILNNYRTLFAQHPVDTGPGPTADNDVTCEGVSAGYFPANMVDTSVTCVRLDYPTHPSSPWGTAAGGQPVIVYAVQDTNSINIQFNGLTQAACIDLASQIFTAADIIEGQVRTNGGNWHVPALSPPITVATITGATGCTGSPSGFYDIQAVYPAQ